MTGNQSQELKQKPWRSTASWVDLYDLYSLLFFFFSNHSYQPRGIPIHYNLGPSTSITKVLCVYIMASNFVLFMGLLSV